VYVELRVILDSQSCILNCVFRIDASNEDQSFGRLVNDDHVAPTATMKKILVDGIPHLCLFACRHISVGDEITYDYGSSEYPWRKPKVLQNLELSVLPFKLTV